MSQFTLKRPPVQPRLGLRADNRRSFWDTYRPTTLSEVMGQDAAVDALRGFLADPCPVALLFHGDTGTGKTSAALALANDLHVNLAADFFHVKSGGADLDTFEEIARLLRFTPWCGWRLILIDEADQATARARQLMLSMLESLPPRTVLVMTTNHPEKFDTRTRDRMVELPFVADSVEGAQRLADAIWHAETGGEDGPSVDTLPGVFEAGKLSFRRVVGAMQALVRDGLRPLPALSGGAPEAEESPAPEPTPEPPAVFREVMPSVGDRYRSHCGNVYRVVDIIDEGHFHVTREGDHFDSGFRYPWGPGALQGMTKLESAPEPTPDPEPPAPVKPKRTRKPRAKRVPVPFACKHCGTVHPDSAKAGWHLLRGSFCTENCFRLYDYIQPPEASPPVSGGAPVALAEAVAPVETFPDAPTLLVAGKPYAYEAFSGPDGRRVVRLAKADGTTYDVAEGPGRVTCECPHFVNRLFELQGRVLCKHVVAALAAGLVAQPDPDRHLPSDADEDDAAETFPATPDPNADPGPRIPIPARKLPPLSRPYIPDPAPEADPTPGAVFEGAAPTPFHDSLRPSTILYGRAVPRVAPVPMARTRHGVTLHEPEPIGHPRNTTRADAGAPAIGLDALVVECWGHARPMGVEVAAHAQDASWAILGAIAELRDDGAGDHVGDVTEMVEIAPEPLPAEGPRRGRLTLIELVEAEADRFLARRNGAGKLMAQALEALAEDIRWTRAETPWEHESRLQLFDEWADENAPAEAR